MRPLKHGLLSYVPHLYIRRDTYYCRADIKRYFHTPEIKQSLKTKDSKVAKVLALSMEYRLQRTYTLKLRYIHRAAYETYSNVAVTTRY